MRDGVIGRRIRTYTDFSSPDANNDKWAFEPSEYRVGAEGTLGCSSNDRTGWERWFLDFEEGGISGNMNRNICRYHGWRGTTNGTSKCAYGWRRVLRIEPRKYGWAVIVGPDLHPEWE